MVTKNTMFYLNNFVQFCILQKCYTHGIIMQEREVRKRGTIWTWKKKLK